MLQQVLHYSVTSNPARTLCDMPAARPVDLSSMQPGGEVLMCARCAAFAKSAAKRNPGFVATLEPAIAWGDMGGMPEATIAVRLTADWKPQPENPYRSADNALIEAHRGVLGALAEERFRRLGRGMVAADEIRAERDTEGAPSELRLRIRYLPQAQIDSVLASRPEWREQFANWVSSYNPAKAFVILITRANGFVTGYLVHATASVDDAPRPSGAGLDDLVISIPDPATAGDRVQAEVGPPIVDADAAPLPPVPAKASAQYRTWAKNYSFSFTATTSEVDAAIELVRECNKWYGASVIAITLFVPKAGRPGAPCYLNFDLDTSEPAAESILSLLSESLLTPCARTRDDLGANLKDYRFILQEPARDTRTGKDLTPGVPALSPIVTMLEAIRALS